MESNPFAPPKSNIEKPLLHARSRVRLVALLAVPQLLLFVTFSSTYVELVWLGAIPVLGGLLAAIAEACLLVGILLLFLRGKGKVLFLIAGAGFLLSIFWGWGVYLSPVMKHSIHTTGFLLAVFGGWVASMYGRQYNLEQSGT